MSLATPDHSALKAEFKVPGGTETNLFDMHPGVARIDHIAGPCRGWVRDIVVTGKRADQEFVTEGTGDYRESGNVERLDAVDAESIDVLQPDDERRSRCRRLP